MEKERNEVIKKLIEIQYERNDIDFSRGTFRVRGDSLDIIPASYSNKGIRVEFFGDEIDRIREFDVLTGDNSWRKKSCSNISCISLCNFKRNC